MLWLLPIVTLSFTKRKLTEVISDSYTKYFVCIGNPKELPSKCGQIANATYSTWNEAVANTKSLDEYMILYFFYKDADVTSTVSFNGKNQFLAFDTIADNNGKFAKIYGNLEITKVDQQVYIFGEENVDGFSGDLNLRLHCSGMNITTISEDIPGVPLFLSSPIKSLHIDYAYAYNYAPVLVTPLLPLNFPKIEYTAQSGNFEKDYVRNNINDTYYIYIPAKQDKNLHFCIYKSEESIKDSPNSDCSHSINTTWMKAVEYIKNEKDVYAIQFVFVDSIDISGKYNFGSSHVFFYHSRKSYNPSVYGSIEFENIDPHVLLGPSEFIQELDVIIHLSGANITKEEFTIPSIIGSPRSVEIFYKNDVTKYDIVPAYGTLDGNRPSVIVHSPNNCVNIGKESFDYILQDESDLFRLHFYKVDKNVTEANYCIGSKKKAPAFCKDMTVTNWETFSKLVNEKEGDILHLYIFDHVSIYDTIDGKFNSIILESIDNGVISGQLRISKKDTFVQCKLNNNSRSDFLASLNLILSVSGQSVSANTKYGSPLLTEVEIHSVDFHFDSVDLIKENYKTFTTIQKGAVLYPLVSTYNKFTESFLLNLLEEKDENKAKTYSFALPKTEKKKSYILPIVLSAIGVVVLLVIIIVIVVIVRSRSYKRIETTSTAQLFPN